MTKKHYIAPAISVVHLYTEGMMASSDTNSISIHNDATPEASQLTNRYGWDSGNWSDSEAND